MNTALNVLALFYAPELQRIVPRPGLGESVLRVIRKIQAATRSPSHQGVILWSEPELFYLRRKLSRESVFKVGRQHDAGQIIMDMLERYLCAPSCGTEQNVYSKCSNCGKGRSGKVTKFLSMRVDSSTTTTSGPVPSLGEEVAAYALGESSRVGQSQEEGWECDMCNVEGENGRKLKTVSSFTRKLVFPLGLEIEVNRSVMVHLGDQVIVAKVTWRLFL